MNATLLSPAVKRAFYLDTSAIRALGRHLPDSPLFRKSFTSAVTFVELLAASQRSAEEYHRCRASVGVLLQNAIHVDWMMPDVRMARAFPALLEIVTIEDARATALQSLVTLLCESETYDRFMRASATHAQGGYALDYFVDYDQTFGADFNRASERFEIELKKEFRNSDRDRQLQMLGLPSGLTAREFGVAFSTHPVNFGISVLATALKISDHVGRTDESFIRALYESYDRSIDHYLRAMSLKSMERPATGAVPGRNDALDIAHFTYFQAMTELVSDDSAMRTLGDRIGMKVQDSRRFLTGS